MRAFLTFISAIAASCISSATTTTRPNILFIAIDDLRCELGCYGVEEIKSPNIDRLAKSGVTFTRAYCQQAVCNPSRASLLTGLRPDTTKVWDLITDFRDTIPNAVTIPQHFRKHGYSALGFGKVFHNSMPDHISWDEPHHWPKNSKLWSKEAKKELQSLQKSMRANGKPEAAIKRLRSLGTERVDIPDNIHIDGAITEQAIAAMRNMAAKDKPFFLAAGFIRPHLPFVVPQKYWDLYDPADIPLAENTYLPKNAPEVAYGDRNMGGLYELRDYMDYRHAPSPFKGSLSEEQQRELKHGYYASVSFIDAQIGRLLNELDELELSENTIVVLWSDHGWKLGEHNGWCKQTNYEIDTRSPLIIRAPRAKANGKQSSALTELVDIYPTLCDLASLPTPDELEGTTLVPLLDDASATVKTAAFSQFPRKHKGRKYMGYAMRTERYRYIEWLDDASGMITEQELYDHQSDPDENENIAVKSEHSELLESLSAQLWSKLPKPVRTPKGSQPNILVLMADDWSAPHAGALGDPTVKTPAFDRLVKEGVLFNNAFVSSPSCTPSRHSVSAGQYHWRLKNGANLGGSIPANVPVYPDLLAEAGYRTGFARKGTAPSKLANRGNDPFGQRFKSFEEFHASLDAGQPFCFWYGAGEPHRPYKLGEGKAIGIDPDSVEVPAFLPDNHTVRSDLADYYARVQRFDRDSARMISLLEKSDQLENTIIIMSGDNGMPFPRAKATLYDAGTKVPLVIRWGNQIKHGHSSEDFVSLTDLAPTILEACGLPVPPEMTGRSLLRQLRTGFTDPARNSVLTGMERHVYPYPARAIRNADFLYIRNLLPSAWPTGIQPGKQPHYDFTEIPWPTEPGAFSHNVDPGPTKQWMLEHADQHPQLNALAFGMRPGDELYDLKTDPHQLKNLARDPAFRETRNQLSAQLTTKLRQSRDPRFKHPDHATLNVRGWTVLLHDELWKLRPEQTSNMLEILTVQLDRVIKTVPPKALKSLQSVTIYVNPAYENKRSGAEYHPGAQWLKDNGRNPAMVKCVEIHNVTDFQQEDIRMPYLLLHELAHAYHDQILGFDDEDIIKAFRKAAASGGYNSVKRWTGKKFTTDKAYAMANHKEYFAETTEALFGQNDFYPFNLKELNEHDPGMLRVLRKKWGVTD